MTHILVASRPGVTDAKADIVVITGNYAVSPVKAIARANWTFHKPVVIVAGRIELDGDNVTRRLSDGSRHSRDSNKVRFLELDAVVVEGIRFIGMHKPDLEFIIAELAEPFDGPTVIVSHLAPPADISQVTLTGKVARWVHHADDAEPLLVTV